MITRAVEIYKELYQTPTSISPSGRIIICGRRHMKNSVAKLRIDDLLTEAYWEQEDVDLHVLRKYAETGIEPYMNVVRAPIAVDTEEMQVRSMSDHAYFVVEDGKIVRMITLFEMLIFHDKCRDDSEWAYTPPSELWDKLQTECKRIRTSFVVAVCAQDDGIAEQLAKDLNFNGAELTAEDFVVQYAKAYNISTLELFNRVVAALESGPLSGEEYGIGISKDKARIQIYEGTKMIGTLSYAVLIVALHFSHPIEISVNPYSDNLDTVRLIVRKLLPSAKDL